MTTDGHVVHDETDVSGNIGRRFSHVSSFKLTVPERKQTIDKHVRFLNNMRSQLKQQISLEIKAMCVCDGISGQCEPLISSICEKVPRITYSKTRLPNFLGHKSYDIAEVFMNSSHDIISEDCYAFSGQFLCAITYPECRKGERIPPCRETCSGIHF